jgi:hypothetical protein
VKEEWGILFSTIFIIINSEILLISSLKISPWLLSVSYLLPHSFLWKSNCTVVRYRRSFTCRHCNGVLNLSSLVNKMSSSGISWEGGSFLWHISRYISVGLCFQLRWFLACLICRPWRWKWYVPPRRRFTFNGIYGVISQMIQIPILLFDLRFPQRWLWRVLSSCCSTVTMEAICSSETSVDLYKDTRPYIPEDINYVYCCLQK